MTSAPPPPGPREFDIIVLGATGLTGQLVVQQLIDIDHASAPRWAVAGRNHDRLTSVLADRGAPHVAALVADATSRPSLAALAARATVVLNLAGPYTPTAETVIEACIDAGTSYVDLSGELPLLRRVNRRFHERARRAGVQVVQMAGWEAFPADLVTLLACQQAAAGTATDAVDPWGPDGPGAADPIRRVDVTVRFTRRPGGAPAPGQSVSGGTLASVVAMIEDRGSRVLGDPAGLLPDSGSARAVRSTSPLRIRPRRQQRRLLGSFTPVAFLDPPVLHRTAALLAEERGAAHRPATVQESLDLGEQHGAAAWARAAAEAGMQRALIRLAHLPRAVRRTATRLARQALPDPGTGPTGRHLHDWAWTVRADATATTGASGTAVLDGVGHPGYTATAAMIVEVGRHLADTGRGHVRAGCLTPATSLGAARARELSAAGLEMRGGATDPV